MSMWFDYQRERFPDFKVIERPYGFATYHYMTIGDTNGVYIEDLYIVPGERNKDWASVLSIEIQHIAREAGMTHLFGSVATEAEGATASLKVLLAHGMTLLSSTNDTILFYKEI